MNADEFVAVVDRYVREVAVSATVKNLTRPPGAKPPPELVRMSDWFHRLSDADKEVLQSVLRWAVSQSVFGFLAVLDGSRSVSDGPEKGAFELFHVTGADRERLNDPNREPLHDKLRL